MIFGFLIAPRKGGVTDLGNFLDITNFFVGVFPNTLIQIMKIDALHDCSYLDI